MLRWQGVHQTDREFRCYLRVVTPTTRPLQLINSPNQPGSQNYFLFDNYFYNKIFQGWVRVKCLCGTTLRRLMPSLKNVLVESCVVDGEVWVESLLICIVRCYLCGVSLGQSPVLVLRVIYVRNGVVCQWSSFFSIAKHYETKFSKYDHQGPVSRSS